MMMGSACRPGCRLNDRLHVHAQAQTHRYTDAHAHSRAHLRRVTHLLLRLRRLRRSMPSVALLRAVFAPSRKPWPTCSVFRGVGGQA